MMSDLLIPLHRQILGGQLTVPMAPGIVMVRPAKVTVRLAARLKALHLAMRSQRNTI